MDSRSGFLRTILGNNFPSADILFRETGNFMARREDYEKALNFFDLSLSKQPDNIKCLSSRAETRSKTFRTSEALKDIAAILQIDPENIIALQHKALVTYLSCEFEKALYYNCRMVSRRTKPDNFVTGVMHCADAIENCIGSRASRPLRDYYKTIRKIAYKKALSKQNDYASQRRKKKKELSKSTKDKSHKLPHLKVKKKIKSKETFKKNLSFFETPSQIVQRSSFDDTDSSLLDTMTTHSSNSIAVPVCLPYPYKPLQDRTKNIENYMAEKYLDKMYHDKIYLRGLVQKNGVECANKRGNAKIAEIAQQGFHSLKLGQEILRSRRPFYFLKCQEAKSDKLKQRQYDALEKIKNRAKEHADCLMKKIRQAAEEEKFRVLIEIIESLRQFCQKTSRNFLVDCEFYLSEMDKIACNAFYMTKLFRPHHSNSEKEVLIKIFLGLPVKEEILDVHVYQPYKNSFVNWRKHCDKYEKQLADITNREELIWCCHELARFNFEMKRFDLARAFARRGFEEAVHDSKCHWIINLMFICVQTDIKQNDRNTALASLGTAKNAAVMLDDSRMLEVLDQCESTIENWRAEEIDNIQLIQQRMKQFVSILPTRQMKDEAINFYRLTNALPIGRRMSIVPGVRYIEERFKNPEEVQKQGTKMKRKRKPSSPTRGVDFMKLIQNHID